jgi:hypothetical protein
MCNSKRALITGMTEQDGPYLSELLLAKGYEVQRLFIPVVPMLAPRSMPIDKLSITASPMTCLPATVFCLTMMSPHGAVKRLLQEKSLEQSLI